jgi:hypothetical protein
MTITRDASREDILLMEDFLECAQMHFDSISAGVSVDIVDEVFFKYTRYANEDWPTDVLVTILARETGSQGRPVRLQRWIHRELLLMREASIARCVRPVTLP